MSVVDSQHWTAAGPNTGGADEPEGGHRAWVQDLRNKEVVFTGDFRKLIGKTRDELKPIARSEGAQVRADVRNTTDIVIRGESDAWKYGDYGAREEEVVSPPGAGVSCCHH